MFRRLWNLIRGFFGLFVSGMERRSPEALLEVEKENLRTHIARFNQGLAAHAALCERLMARTRELEAEEASLKEKTAVHLRAGNREVAGQYALRLQAVGKELADNREQLKKAEETYANLVRARDDAVRGAQAKIDSLRLSIDDMKAKKALAEMNEMAAGMVTSVGGSGDTLDRLRAMVDEEKSKAAGKARVSGDALAATEASLKDAERKALADQALADFAAKEGQAASPPPAAEPPAQQERGKSMGPTEKQN
jgi:phage shock protein A